MVGLRVRCFLSTLQCIRSSPLRISDTNMVDTARRKKVCDGRVRMRV